MSDLQDVVTDGVASMGSGVVSQPIAFGTPTCVDCAEHWDLRGVSLGFLLDCLSYALGMLLCNIVYHL
jgi:hypothetical protein